MKKLPVGITIFFVMVTLGIAVSLQQVTYIRWWLPASCSLLIAIPFGYLLKGVMSRLTNRSSNLLNSACGAVVAFALLLGGFYSLNFYLSDEQSQRIEHGKVIAKRSIQRRHSRRVGRNRYVPGEIYYEYRLDISLPDGHRTSLDVSTQEYIHTRHGSEILVTIEQGFFGIDVIKYTPHPATRKRI